MSVYHIRYVKFFLKVAERGEHAHAEDGWQRVTGTDRCPT